MYYIDGVRSPSTSFMKEINNARLSLGFFSSFCYMLHHNKGGETQETGTRAICNFYIQTIGKNVLCK